MRRLSDRVNPVRWHRREETWSPRVYGENRIRVCRSMDRKPGRQTHNEPRWGNLAHSSKSATRIGCNGSQYQAEKRPSPETGGSFFISARCQATGVGTTRIRDGFPRRGPSGIIGFHLPGSGPFWRRVFLRGLGQNTTRICRRIIRGSPTNPVRKLGMGKKPEYKWMIPPPLCTIQPLTYLVRALRILPEAYTHQLPLGRWLQRLKDETSRRPPAKSSCGLVEMLPGPKEREGPLRLVREFPGRKNPGTGVRKAPRRNETPAERTVRRNVAKRGWPQGGGFRNRTPSRRKRKEGDAAENAAP